MNAAHDTAITHADSDNMTNPAACGPKTPDGKRVSARNATTHGLFARDVVLPHLGEDPAGYKALLEELTAQIRPKNLLDQHYTEKIAAASWRLRRLHRWQAQLFEDPELTEDEALSKLDRVMRHETALHRQIDTAVRMLGREVPGMFTARLREEQMALAQVTERDCKGDHEWDWVVANNTREQMRKLSACPSSLAHDSARLDAAPTTGFCQNELAAANASSLPRDGGGGEERAGGGSSAAGTEGVLPTPELRRTDIAFPLPGERFYPDDADNVPSEDWRKARLRAQATTTICQNEPPASTPPEAQPDNDRPLSHSSGGGVPKAGWGP